MLVFCCFSTLSLTFRDLYTSPKIIRLKELDDEKSEIEAKDRMTSKDKKRLLVIEEESKPLIQFLEDAKFQRQEIKKEIGMICRFSFVILLFICNVIFM